MYAESILGLDKAVKEARETSKRLQTKTKKVTSATETHTTAGGRSSSVRDDILESDAGARRVYAESIQGLQKIVEKARADTDALAKKSRRARNSFREQV